MPAAIAPTQERTLSPHWLRRVHQRYPHAPTWLLVAAAVVLIGIVAASLVLAIYWPFSEKKIVAALQQDFPGTVKFAKFRSTYFPHPGCVAEDATFTSQAGKLATAAPDVPPLIFAKTFTIEANYWDLFLRPGHLSRIMLDGLLVRVPVLGPGGNPPAKIEPSSTSVGEVIANNARLEIAKEGEPPLRFDFHRVLLQSVRRDSALSYEIALANPLPPGELRAKGSLGPWKIGDRKETPLSGSFVFENADLSVFHGVAGTLHSEGKFSGALGRVETQGSADVPDFEVVRSKHQVPLKTKFKALVDGTNGDVTLREVHASFLGTVSRWDGRIAPIPGAQEKTAALNVTVRDGRIQDVLRLFVKEKTPPLTGVANFHARVTLPPGKRPFLQKVMLDGDFVIADGEFTGQDTQAQVEQLSKRSLGKKGAKETPHVTSEIKGHVQLRNAHAGISELSFVVPGADAELHGVYELETEKIDFHGDLKTAVEVSRTATGLKALLLEPLDPLLKRKGAGAVVPVGMTGTYHDPHFGVELTGKK